MEKPLTKLKNIWQNLTVEPLAFITYIIIFITDVSTKELYIQKACQVNLGYGLGLCTNLTNNEELQKEVQEYVTGVQAHNEFLQKFPSIVFALFAGPLSDTYGRKPLLLVPLIGFFILNLVYLINVVWFHELKVEYMLFEAVQDLTGGRVIFMLAARCYIMDITSVDIRTARICWLEATLAMAIMIGSPLGTIIKENLGYTVLHCIVLALVAIALTYCYFLKDSIQLVGEEKKKAMLEEKEAGEIKCDKGVCCSVLKMVTSGFKALARVRPERKHILCFFLINNIAMVAEKFGSVLFLFYQLQYKMESNTFGWLLSAWAVGSLFGQLFLAPFLIIKLGFKDTTIIMMGLLLNSTDVFLETFMNQVWFLFLCWGGLQIFWDCMFTCTLSAISKLAEPSETGKLLSLVGIANALVSMAAAPAFNLIYQATLKTYPAVFMYVAIAFFLLAFAMTLYTHLDMRRREGTRMGDDQEKTLSNQAKLVASQDEETKQL